MARPGPVTLDDRQAAHRAALSAAAHAAERWLTARVRGVPSTRVDEALTEAINQLRRTERRLRETEKARARRHQ